LRTPIATLTIYCEGLTDGVIRWDEDTQQVLTEQTDRLARLTEDIDEVSRAEEGRITLERERCPVNDLIRTAAASNRENYVRHGVSLTAETDSDASLVVDVDPARLAQILDNLLANALRHTPHGGKVRLHARAAGEEVEIIVTDTGNGITPAQLAHVFERFYRGDDARDRDHGGSGIGLTISRAIANAHGGSLVATSDGPGHGATFTLALPRLNGPRSGATSRPG
ncbi:MAG: HAMP domain-containing sensor histidine kinase, partial [Ornithinimicrobium sp.]|uniref:sensor histidine kinase n=1 Tax=Ornithinimicrobium sp. TaxID=1977084 RepID=UPI0026DEB58D